MSILSISLLYRNPLRNLFLASRKKAIQQRFHLTCASLSSLNVDNAPLKSLLRPKDIPTISLRDRNVNVHNRHPRTKESALHLLARYSSQRKTLSSI